VIASESPGQANGFQWFNKVHDAGLTWQSAIHNENEIQGQRSAVCAKLANARARSRVSASSAEGIKSLAELRNYRVPKIAD
jgi:hypothetical protein